MLSKVYYIEIDIHTYMSADRGVNNSSLFKKHYLLLMLLAGWLDAEKPLILIGKTILLLYDGWLAGEEQLLRDKRKNRGEQLLDG